MIRTVSTAVLESGIRVPADSGFFAFPQPRAIGIFNGRYVALGKMLAQTDENIGFTKQISTCTVQSNGVMVDLHGFTPTGLVSLTLDPDDISKVCWLLRCTSNDADTAGTGAKRSEFAGGSIKDTPFVFGVATRPAESWAGTIDEQIIYQIHTDLPISPSLSAIVSGSTVRIEVRFGAPGQRGSQTLYTGVIGTSWDKWVVSGVCHATLGKLRISRNGQQIVGYTGPFGYSDDLMSGYIKSGLYHWTNSGNTWDAAVPSRGVYLKGFWQVDPLTVSHDDMVTFMSEI